MRPAGRRMGKLVLAGAAAHAAAVRDAGACLARPTATQRPVCGWFRIYRHIYGRGHMSHRTRQPGADIVEAIGARLLEHPSVHDCAVLERVEARTGETVRVAYVVLSGPFRPERLHEHLRSSLPGVALPEAYVAIPAIPLTPAGRRDEAALARLEIIDDRLAREWEDRLQATPGIERVAVLDGEREPRRPPLH